MQDWKRVIICPQCGALHKKPKLKAKEIACCARCGRRLLRGDEGLEYRLFAFSFAAIVFFVISNLFFIVSIDIGGISASMRLLEAIWRLFEDGYVLIAFFSLLVLEIYPLLLMGALFISSLAMIVGLCRLSWYGLLLASFLESWSMIDIFFVSILVAMVKIYEYAQITFGIAFWSLAIFVAIEIYLLRSIGMESFWEAWERRFESC